MLVEFLLFVQACLSDNSGENKYRNYPKYSHAFDKFDSFLPLVKGSTLKEKKKKKKKKKNASFFSEKQK